MAWKDVPKRKLTVSKELVTLTFTLKTRKGHQFPLFDEEVSAVLARGANLLQLLTHELPLVVADALREGALDVDCESFGTLDS